MPARRVNPNLVKLHRSYTTGELAMRLGVHKNTVRNWQSAGLEPLIGTRPILFHGEAVRLFLVKRNTLRKRSCPPGTLYCFRCREPRPPALGMVDYEAQPPRAGNLRALCEACGTIMHRRARANALAAILPGIDVQITRAKTSLVGSLNPSLICDKERQGSP